MKTLMQWLLRGYKWLISPLLPPACRFQPTCSEYAAQAIAHYGMVRGGMKAAWRLLRCQPFARGGYDPVFSDHNHHDLSICKDPRSALLRSRNVSRPS